MDIYSLFLDDSKQKKPGIAFLGPLLCVAGFAIKIEEVPALSQNINALCKFFHFPSNEEFKWSPDKKLWMHKSLVEDARQSFFLQITRELRKLNAVVFIVIEDTQYDPVCQNNHEFDVISMILERYERFLLRQNAKGIVIVDSPSGDKKDEEKYLSKCINIIQHGTKYVKPESFLMDVLTTSSSVSRMIQVADLIAGSSLSRVAHDYSLARTIFESYKVLIDNDSGRYGGIGFKIHPGVRFRNLYHWICGDITFYDSSGYTPLPNRSTPHFENPYKDYSSIYEEMGV